MRSLAKHTGLAVVAALMSGCFCKDVPVEQRLADCTNSTLRLQMTVQEFPPYQLVLGMPQSATGQMTFRGEVILSQSTGTVARVQITSNDVTPCNWLDGLAGYVLTWGRTDDAERLESFLTRGQTYDVVVHFTELPPRESSLWLSSMGRIGL